MSKVAFFPHGEQFEDQWKLRDWLETSLRNALSGKYTMDKATNISSLEAGAIVFFHKNNYIVGYAVVEEPKRALTKNEIDSDIFGGQNVIKFIPETIVTLRDDQFFPLAEVAEILGKKQKQLQSLYVVLDGESDWSRVFDIFAGIAKRPKFYV